MPPRRFRIIQTGVVLVFLLGLLTSPGLNALSIRPNLSLSGMGEPVEPDPPPVMGEQVVKLGPEVCQGWLFGFTSTQNYIFIRFSRDGQTYVCRQSPVDGHRKGLTTLEIIRTAAIAALGKPYIVTENCEVDPTPNEFREFPRGPWCGITDVRTSPPPTTNQMHEP